MGFLRKVKEKVSGKVRSLRGSHRRDTGPMAPKAGVGTHNRYSDGGRVRKKK